MDILPIAINIIFAYFFGAIPTGYLAGRMLKGIDIREHGSRNMGATNVMRVLGKGPGAAVLLFDIGKGIIPIVLAEYGFGIINPLILVIIGIVAVCGHNWTIFLRFKGGKGVATSLGVLIGLAVVIPGIRPVLILTVLTWLAVFLSFAYVSLASICASTVLPILMVLYNAPLPLIIMAILLCLFSVIRHRSNISRLVKGQENRIKLPFHK